MIKTAGSLQEVKAKIRGYDQLPVSVTVDLGRGKRQAFMGRLTGVYPSLFTVTPDEKGYLGKTSYSYAEVLCGAVRIAPKNKS